MNYKSRIILSLLALMMAINVSAANKKTTVYAFGFSACFTDSVVYFTDIQRLDGATVDTKTKFLADRSQYSDQMRQYFNDNGQRNRTCIIVYGLSQNEAEKKLVKLRNKYTKGGRYDIKYLTANDFAFKVPSYDSEEKVPVAKVDESKKKGGKLKKGDRPVKEPKKKAKKAPKK